MPTITKRPIAKKFFLDFIRIFQSSFGRLRFSAEKIPHPPSFIISVSPPSGKVFCHSFNEKAITVHRY
jgi:hypothetical protein